MHRHAGELSVSFRLWDVALVRKLRRRDGVFKVTITLGAIDLVRSA